MTHRELIDSLGYEALQEATGADYDAVVMWRVRSRIPTNVWGKVVMLARQKRKPATIQELYFAVYPQ